MAFFENRLSSSVFSHPPIKCKTRVISNKLIPLFLEQLQPSSEALPLASLTAWSLERSLSWECLQRDYCLYSSLRIWILYMNFSSRASRASQRLENRSSHETFKLLSRSVKSLQKIMKLKAFWDYKDSLFLLFSKWQRANWSFEHLLNQVSWRYVPLWNLKMRYAVNFFTNVLLPEIKIEWLFGNPSPSSELSTLQN